MPDIASLNLDKIKQDAQIKASILRRRPAVMAEIFGRQSQKRQGTPTREMVSSMSAARSHNRKCYKLQRSLRRTEELFSREEKEAEVKHYKV